MWDDDRPKGDEQLEMRRPGRAVWDQRYRRKDGIELWTIASCNGLFDNDGRAIGAFGMFTDITERKQAEEAPTLNSDLFAKIIEQAPGGVYVLDAQLRVRHVNTEALPTFATVQPVIGRDLSEVLEALWGPDLGRECTAIVSHTLETGEQYISPRFDHFRQDIGEQEVYEWQTQRVTLPDGQYGVVCYFQNVTVRERAAEALLASETLYRGIGEKLLHVQLAGSEVVVSVTDTGIGIPVDKLCTIFEMFSQVEGALSRTQGGLGIGLTLVKRLVELHGGNIEARSRGMGQGSEFIVRLPIVVEANHPRELSEDASKVQPTPYLRVLVVDDNRDAGQATGAGGEFRSSSDKTRRFCADRSVVHGTSPATLAINHQ